MNEQQKNNKVWVSVNIKFMKDSNVWLHNTTNLLNCRMKTTKRPEKKN